MATFDKITYGRIYNGHVVLNPNFTPVDWSVPTDLEVITLWQYIDPSADEFGSSSAGGPLKETGTTYWNAPNAGATNSTLFSAYGGGQRNYSNGTFNALGVNGYFWTKTLDGSQVKGYMLYSDYAWIYGFASDERNGSSVRLIYTGGGTPPSTIQDYDGNTYDVIQIGTQYWTKQNWASSHLNNGIEIPNVTGNTEWSTLGDGPGIDYVYGYLYNWFTIDGRDNDFINGMHVSTNTEWSDMVTYLGGNTVAGGKLKELGTEHWNTNVGGTNEVNFSGVGSGLRLGLNGAYSNLDNNGFVWTSTSAGSTDAWSWNYTDGNATIFNNSVDRERGYAIRLVRDLTTQEQLDYSDGDVIETVFDYDGNSYGVVKINDKGWTNINLRTSHYTNGDSIPTGYNDTEWSNLSTGAYAIYGDTILVNVLAMSAYDNNESYVGEIIEEQKINNLIIRGSLNINNTITISGITNDYLSLDENMLFTGQATSGYTDYKYYRGTDGQVLFNSGGTITGTTNLIFNGTDLIVTGNTKTDGCLITDRGAMCIKMINKTGSPTLKGRLVTYNTSFDNSFTYYPFGNAVVDPYIGVTLEDSVVDGEYTYIVIYGECDIYLSSNSRKVYINDPLSSWNSTINGEILNSETSGWLIGYSLEESEPGNMIRCMLQYNDKQTEGGYF